MCVTECVFLTRLKKMILKKGREREREVFVVPFTYASIG